MYRERERDMAFEHFSHEHPIILAEENDSDPFWCIVCGVYSYETSFYRCSRGCWPCSLHKYCAEIKLPSEIQHPLHPDHPLTLLLPHNYISRGCKSCGKELAF